ncbi:MAG: cation:proton antiporter [Bacteroidales bacterium]|nr:cation:proton antiporter [Bacteroidales bacterium]
MSLLRLRRIPTVIMEIVIGFLIGKFLFSYFTPESTEILDFLAFTGFMFLMFLSGLEIDVDQIVASFPRRRITLTRFQSNPLLVGLTIFIITVTLSYGGSLILSKYIAMESTFYFALIMITTSVGIIIPVLKERGDFPVIGSCLTDHGARDHANPPDFRCTCPVHWPGGDVAWSFSGGVVAFGLYP